MEIANFEIICILYKFENIWESQEFIVTFTKKCFFVGFVLFDICYRKYTFLFYIGIFITVLEEFLLKNLTITEKNYHST